MDITQINHINTETQEGKLLMAALVKISTESQTDKQPDEILLQVIELANNMYNQPI